MLDDLPGAGTAWLLDSRDTVQQVISQPSIKIDHHRYFASLLHCSYFSPYRLVLCQVKGVSERVVKLHSLLGDGVDIAAMVTREPR